MFLFSGFKWILNDVEMESYELCRWISADEWKVAMALPVGGYKVFFGRGKCVRVR